MLKYTQHIICSVQHEIKLLFLLLVGSKMNVSFCMITTQSCSVVIKLMKEDRIQIHQVKQCGISPSSLHRKYIYIYYIYNQFYYLCENRIKVGSCSRRDVLLDAEGRDIERRHEVLVLVQRQVVFVIITIMHRRFSPATVRIRTRLNFFTNTFFIFFTYSHRRTTRGTITRLSVNRNY
jgi:hypothetical protein